MSQPFRLVFSGPAAGTVASAHFGHLIERAQSLLLRRRRHLVRHQPGDGGEPFVNTTFELEHDLLINALSNEISTLGAGGGSIISITEAGEVQSVRRAPAPILDRPLRKGRTAPDDDRRLRAYGHPRSGEGSSAARCSWMPIAGARGIRAARHDSRSRPTRQLRVQHGAQQHRRGHRSRSPSSTVSTRATTRWWPTAPRDRCSCPPCSA